jgi:hypothetical protein
MTSVSITPLPTPPSRQDPINFADRGDEFLGALPQFAIELESARVQVEDGANYVAETLPLVEQSAIIASGAANYKGDYNASTTYQVGQSVSYNGQTYIAKTVNTGVTPVVGVNWLLIKSGSGSLSYGSRSSLRTAPASDGDQVVVESLGLFVFYDGSTELDDDETCFATTSGRWLLSAASFELVQAFTANVESYQDARLSALESSPTLLLIKASQDTTVTSIGSLSQVAFAISMPGAAVGDIAIVNPSVGVVLDSRLAIYAYAAANAVQVTITNPSASSASLSNPTTWNVAVIKSI